jgi:hypoxanthine phosphoribosyltransferase
MNLFYNFEAFTRDVNRIAESVEKSGKKYDCIVGIARGGVIPAVALSHKMNIPFQALHWSKNEPTVIDLGFKLNDKILLVDDIVDTGQTMQEIIAIHGHVDTASLVYNSGQSFKPNYWGWMIDRQIITNWIDFWWEKV